MIFSGSALRESISTETLSLHESRFRAGAGYDVAPMLALRGGATSLGRGTIRPSTGFMIEQSLGDVGIRAEYALLLEPYALGTMHLITLRFLL